MNNEKEVLLKELSQSVLDMDEDKAVDKSKECIEKGINAYEAIEGGLAKGMDQAGKLYEEGEYYIPELLMCSDAMYAGLDVLKPHISKEEQGKKYKAVIGVIQGDTHDIGKNLVKIMMETEGFDVIDLGKDVPPAEFIGRAKETGACIIALSTLMTTTMAGMKEVIDMLEKESLRGSIKVIVGGGPISQRFADKIDADGYAADASRAAKLAKSLAESISL
jgi:dimethylamine corrinoid protein